MKLSIIIPVYNVEKYLRKCLDSCLSQDISDDEYEIICVNDGSPDKCGKILDEYKTKYSNLSVITQKNQGLSVARNNGLAAAKGDYVWFIDSDDCIKENCLSRLLVYIESMNSKLIDLIQIGYKNVYENSSYQQCGVTPKWNGSVSGIEYMIMPNLPTAAQFNIYRRSLLIDENLSFYPGILHEDIEFKPRVLHFCKNCICFDETIYNYLQRSNGSITSSFKLKNALDLITGIQSLSTFEDKYAVSNEEKHFFSKRISVSVNLIISGYNTLSIKDKAIVRSTFVRNRFVFAKMINAKSPKHKIEGLLLYLSPYISLKLLAKLIDKIN